MQQFLTPVWKLLLKNSLLKNNSKKLLENSHLIAQKTSFFFFFQQYFCCTWKLPFFQKLLDDAQLQNFLFYSSRHFNYSRILNEYWSFSAANGKSMPVKLKALNWFSLYLHASLASVTTFSSRATKLPLLVLPIYNNSEISSSSSS